MCELCHFSAHSSSTKKFEIINFKWLNTELLELISIVSADCRADIFACSFSAVYGAELSSSSNDFSSSMTWQMLSRAVLFVTRHRSKLVGILLVYLISFQTHHLDKGWLNARRFHFQCDLQNMVKYFSSKSKCSCTQAYLWFLIYSLLISKLHSIN